METIKNIQHISDSYLCANCGACVTACPAGAISLQSSPIGRMFAAVGENCIQCGLCLNVCPSQTLEAITRDVSEESVIGNIRSVSIGRSTREDIYTHAQSGGVATMLLTFLFETGKIDGAIVVRMQSAVTPYGEAFIATSAEELKQSQKSCYTPVALLEALKAADKFQSLAVVGLPCHLQGVESLQKNFKQFSNIHYKIGLICERSQCAGILDALSPKPMRKLQKKIIFKLKGMVDGRFIPYKDAMIAIQPETGNTVLAPRSYRFALKEMFTTPRCRICPDKLNRLADVTLGDPWEMEGADMKFGDNVIAVRTETGEHLLREAIRDGYVQIRRESSTDELARGQHIAERVRQVLRYTDGLRGVPGEEEKRIRRFITRDQAKPAAIRREAQKILWKTRIKDIVKRILHR